jgi:hypothetical protein
MEDENLDLNYINKYTKPEEVMVPAYTLEDYKSFENWVKSMYSIYEKSILLKNVGEILHLTPTISAIGKKLEYSEKKRIETLYKELDKRVNNLDKEKINFEFVNSEEFYEIVFKVFNYTRREYREDKIKYFANLLINYATYEHSRDFYKEGILESLSKYTIEHIIVMKFIFNVHLNKSETEADVDGRVVNIEGMDPIISEICVSNLLADGFLQSGFWTSMWITEYGIQFINLIEEYKK